MVPFTFRFQSHVISVIVKQAFILVQCWVRKPKRGIKKIVSNTHYIPNNSKIIILP